MLILSLLAVIDTEIQECAESDICVERRDDTRINRQSAAHLPRQPVHVGISETQIAD